MTEINFLGWFGAWGVNDVFLFATICCNYFRFPRFLLLFLCLIPPKKHQIVSKDNRKLFELRLKKEAHDSQEQTSSLFYNSPSMGQSYSWTQAGGKKILSIETTRYSALKIAATTWVVVPIDGKTQLKTKDFNKIKVRRETSRSSVITGMGNIEDLRKNLATISWVRASLR